MRSQFNSIFLLVGFVFYTGLQATEIGGDVPSTEINLYLRQQMSNNQRHLLQTGDDERVSLTTMGCDPSLETCKDKYQWGISVVYDSEDSQLASQLQAPQDQFFSNPAINQGQQSESPQDFYTTNPSTDQDLDCSLPSSLVCDVEALSSFKELVTRGSEALSNWQGGDPCEWNYVECQDVDEDNWRVTRVVINDEDVDYKLSGELVSDFSKMRYMKRLQIFFQNFTSTLPPEYSVLTSMKYAGFGSNQLIGFLPVEYSTWINLINFEVNTNKFSKQQLPKEYSTWTNCDLFAVGDNSFTGSLPVEYSSMSNMEIFRVYVNELTGELPIQYSVWSELGEFSVYNNYFSGVLPVHFSAWGKITYFDSEINNLLGIIPEEYSVWKKIDSIIIANNVLTGTLPMQFSVLDKLLTFWVEYNLLSGTLPVQYSAMDKLEDFDGAENNFEGGVPEEWNVAIVNL